MESQSALLDELRLLEGQLATATIEPERLAQLIAADCIEFGASGRRYNKSQILEAAGCRDNTHLSMTEFEIRHLGPGLVLVTYFARQYTGAEPRCSRRSSIWKKEQGEWQLLFHQGTLSPCA